MLLQRIQIKNFRCFKDFDLDINGKSLTIVAPNGGGKTALLWAIGSALSGVRGLDRRDFQRLDSPVEIVATLTGFTADDQSAFVDAIRFPRGGPTLDIGIRAVWDEDADRVDVTWGYPENDWLRVRRSARERLKLVWLPADRDPSRLVAFVGGRSVLERLLDSMDLDDALDDALVTMKSAMAALVADAEMAQLLGTLDNDLASVIPDVIPGTFDVETAATTSRDLLAQFELALSYAGPHAPVSRQSSGLAQLAAFVVALQVIRVAPTIVLVDEPELSLHPQAQRSSFTALSRHALQSLGATHSSSLISAVDPRNIVRLKRSDGDTKPRTPRGLTAEDALKLSRYATAETAEAYFARSVIFVEGPSDFLALRVVARTIGVDLDARGVALVSLQGAGLFGTYLRLLGPQGLDLDVLGLCDADAEADWQTKLTAAGVTVTDGAAMNTAGFFVCRPDLEAELIRALGEGAVEAVIDEEGQTARLARYVDAPERLGLSRAEQLGAFARNNKTRWAPRLADELSPASVPAPLRELLSRV